MTLNISEQSARELRRFFGVTLLNLVLGVLAIAFGLQGIVTTLEQGGILGLAPLIRLLAGGAGVILGLLWIRSGTQVLKGIVALREEYRAVEKPISEVTLTGLIVRMVSLYRDHQGTVSIMILAGTLCGFSLFVLGLATGVEVFEIYNGGMTFTLNNLLIIPAMVLTLGVALASLLSSWYFSRFVRVWNQRLHEIEKSEHALKTTLGLMEE
jgi:hypothetical protein